MKTSLLIILSLTINLAYAIDYDKKIEAICLSGTAISYLNHKDSENFQKELQARIGNIEKEQKKKSDLEDKIKNLGYKVSLVPIDQYSKEYKELRGWGRGFDGINIQCNSDETQKEIRRKYEEGMTFPETYEDIRFLNYGSNPNNYSIRDIKESIQRDEDRFYNIRPDLLITLGGHSWEDRTAFSNTIAMVRKSLQVATDCYSLQIKLYEVESRIKRMKEARTHAHRAVAYDFYIKDFPQCSMAGQFREKASIVNTEINKEVLKQDINELRTRINKVIAQ